jgi:hypothetical protein
MPAQLNSKSILLCGAVLALAAAFAWYWQGDPPPVGVAPAVTAPPKAWAGSIGPGALKMDQGPGAASQVEDLEEIPQGMVRVDERGQLITDVQLHNAIDSYLLHADVPSRQVAADRLRHYLQRQLTGAGAANVEAQTLVTRYLAYMDQHDAALERIRFVATGAEGLTDQAAEQFAAWLAQRKTMRQAMLGATVYQEWFAADDARCAELLGARDAQTKAAGDAAQAQDALACATEAGRTFAAIATQERQWARHWASYRYAARQLAERDPARRAAALGNLRQQIFSSDADRERAQTMNLP